MLLVVQQQVKLLQLQLQQQSQQLLQQQSLFQQHVFQRQDAHVKAVAERLSALEIRLFQAPSVLGAKPEKEDPLYPSQPAKSSWLLSDVDFSVPSLKEFDEIELEPIKTDTLLEAAGFCEMRKPVRNAFQVRFSDEDSLTSSSTNPQEVQDVEPKAELKYDTVMKCIMSGRHEEAVALLRQQHIPGLNNVNQDNWTLLHYALVHCQKPDVALSLLRRADFTQINAKHSYDGATALHYAAYYGDVEVCKALLARPDFTEVKAQLRRDVGRGKSGDTAMDVAKRLGHMKMVDMLQKASSS